MLSRSEGHVKLNVFPLRRCPWLSQTRNKSERRDNLSVHTNESTLETEDIFLGSCNRGVLPKKRSNMVPVNEGRERLAKVVIQKKLGFTRG